MGNRGEPIAGHGSQRRRAVRGAAVLFVLAVATGCQAAVAPGAASQVPAPSPAASDSLAAALDRLKPGYTFEATVTVGRAIATRATGVGLNGASEFMLESQGATITYLTIPPRAWVFDADGGWTELNAGSPLGDPVDALRRPTSTDYTTPSGVGNTLRATYPAAALGLAGDPVTITISVGPDGTITATYRTDTPTGPAVSEAHLTPATGLAPIVPPPST